MNAKLPALGPNWFAVVMGTGIVANAAVTLPQRSAFLDDCALIVWIIAAGLLAVLLALSLAQLPRHYLNDPALSHFYGAPAMALMTVGSGAIVVAPTPLVTLSATLWVTGTLLGLWTTVVIPIRMRRTYQSTAFGGWLMPVVPPMVSAAGGAVLLPHLPSAWQVVMTAVCWTLFAIALTASTPLILLIIRKTLVGRTGGAATRPTLFIVVGPLGQSATAAHGLAPDARFAVVYASIVLAAASAWLVVASVLVIGAEPPFAMTWWSFTFPVGTVVTGMSGLATATGSWALDATTISLFAVLVVAWAFVATRTLAGLRSGGLLPSPQTA